MVLVLRDGTVTNLRKPEKMAQPPEAERMSSFYAQEIPQFLPLMLPECQNSGKNLRNLHLSNVLVAILLLIMIKFSIALFSVKTSSTRLITNVQQMSENGSMLPH